MTDLTQAIEELRRQTPTDEPWVDDDFFDRPALAAELSTILNAVLSGDLIPKADADLAELQALRDERDAYKAASEAAHTDITTYLRIVADMTQEAEAAATELAPLRAQVERLKAAFRVNMLRYGPPGTSHEEIDAAISAALTEGAAP